MAKEPQSKVTQLLSDLDDLVAMKNHYSDATNECVRRGVSLMRKSDEIDNKIDHVVAKVKACANDASKKPIEKLLLVKELEIEFRELITQDKDMSADLDKWRNEVKILIQEMENQIQEM